MINSAFVKLPNGSWELGRLEGPACGNLFREFVNHWGLRGDVASDALELGECYQRSAGGKLWIISGFRTEEEQRRLIARGGPVAEVGLSTHTSVPATGFDIGTDFELGREGWRVVGYCAACLGLRWGGGSPMDQHGIPLDKNHFDRGPRTP